MIIYDLNHILKIEEYFFRVHLKTTPASKFMTMPVSLVSLLLPVPRKAGFMTRIIFTDTGHQ